MCGPGNCYSKSGAGFHPDFSGRDNLYFGGSLIGINREEMARLEPEIIDF